MRMLKKLSLRNNELGKWTHTFTIVNTLGNAWLANKQRVKALVIKPIIN